MLIDLESPDLSGDVSPAVSPKAGPDVAAETTLDYTSAVCIIGGGIAGLVLARALAANGTEVLVLEAGGLELEDRSQILFQYWFAGGQVSHIWRLVDPLGRPDVAV
jgi:hypothetical protein